MPSAMVVLESLPLNANGKVDRKLLPEPEFVSADQYEAPHGEVEETLAAIWAEVLGINRVGRNDNFFEVGGDSILSLQIVTKARRAGWKITPRQLFERQTIATLASGASEAMSESVTEELSLKKAQLQDYLDAGISLRYHLATVRSKISIHCHRRRKECYFIPWKRLALDCM